MSMKIPIFGIVLLLSLMTVYAGNVIVRDGLVNATDAVIGDTLYVDSGGGNVGIGTVSPGVKLDVVGNVSADAYFLPLGQKVVGTGFRKVIDSTSGEQEVGRYYDVARLQMSELAGFIEFKVTIEGSAVGMSYDAIFAPSYVFSEYPGGSSNWHLLIPSRKFERTSNIPDEFAIAVKWADGHAFDVRVIKTAQGGPYATNARSIVVSIKDPTSGIYSITEQSGTGNMSIPTYVIYSGPVFNVNTFLRRRYAKV